MRSRFSRMHLVLLGGVLLVTSHSRAFGVLQGSDSSATGQQVFEFVYDPDNPDNASGYTMFDGHVRCCRSNPDENWSGSNSLQVWTVGRHGVSVFDGWLDELPGPITHAEIEYQLRNVAGQGGDPLPMVVNVFPMAVPVEIGNGDGLAAPGWMTWEHQVSNVTDPSSAIGWGDFQLGQNGPIADEDYWLDPMVENIVDAEAYGRHTEFHAIDITPIAQGWQNDEFPNHGIFMKGAVGPGGPDAKTTDATLYFVGADTASSGFPGAIDPQEFRTMPVLRVTVMSDGLPGDVNSDGNVNNLDITAFVGALSIGGGVDDPESINAFLALVPGGSFGNADVNADLSVNNLDITPFIGELAQIAAVPEPAGLSMLLAMALLVGRGRGQSRRGVRSGAV